MVAHIAKNLGLLESGLNLYRSATTDGIEFRLPYSSPVAGPSLGSARRCPSPPRIDVLAIDAQEGYVVIECKLLQAIHTVVGQLLAYVAILRERFPEGTRIRAFIVCKRASPLLWYALREVPDIEFTVFTYECPYGLPELATFRRMESPLGLQQLRFLL